MKLRIKWIDTPFIAALLTAGSVMMAGGCASPAGQPPAATKAPAIATAVPTAAPAATTASAPIPVPTTGAVAELTETALKNGSYELPDLGRIQLQDARYENKYGDGATQVNRVGYQTSAFGDLNGDGVKDAVAILWVNTGGSGTFIYLVPILNVAGSPQQSGSLFLGDRVRLADLFIADGKINAVTRSDPRGSGPQQDTTRVLRVEGSALRQLSEQTAAADYSGANLAGTYRATLPGASGGDRQITLALLANRTATMTTQFTGKGEPVTQKGTWSGSGTAVRLSITESGGRPVKNDITFELRGSDLVSTEWDKSQYGSEGLKLTRQQ